MTTLQIIQLIIDVMFATCIIYLLAFSRKAEPIIGKLRGMINSKPAPASQPKPKERGPFSKAEAGKYVCRECGHTAVITEDGFGQGTLAVEAEEKGKWMQLCLACHWKRVAAETPHMVRDVQMIEEWRQRKVEAAMDNLASNVEKLKKEANESNLHEVLTASGSLKIQDFMTKRQKEAFQIFTEDGWHFVRFFKEEQGVGPSLEIRKGNEVTTIDSDGHSVKPTTIKKGEK